MSHEAKIHAVQIQILRDLLFAPSGSFSHFQKATGLDSDHVKFHIRRLEDLGYIAKQPDSKLYALTSRGKEYANKLDTDSNTLERQPKSAVIIVLQNDRDDVLVQERLKHPYFGFWGYPGGKIRWGETIIEATERELLEETGLAADISYQGVYHEHVRSHETNELLEDKIFHVIHGVNPIGSLKTEFEGGRNSWMSLSDLAAVPTKYASTDIETKVGLGELSFIEATQIYNKNEF